MALRGTPPMRRVPWEGSWRREMIFNIVDFPHPDAPVRHTCPPDPSSCYVLYLRYLQYIYSVGSWRRKMSFNIVDFPHPDAPVRHT